MLTPRSIAILTSLILLLPLATNAGPDIGLADYKLVDNPIILPNVEDDASAITFCPETRSLFVALNNPTCLIELDMEGKSKRRINLQGFHDTEGVAWVKGRTFAVIEERRRNLAFINVGTTTKSIQYRKAKTFLIEPQPFDNVGIEGVASDSSGNRLFIVKEKEPRRIYEVTMPEGSSKPRISFPWDVEKGNHGMKDLAGVFFHEPSGHLLILSEQSECIVECTTAGKKVARLSLKAGSAGLSADIPQPEGITMDDKGTLYICSEPNLIYIFKK